MASNPNRSAFGHETAPRRTFSLLSSKRTQEKSDLIKLTLISHHLCPYVQRAAIALAEKDVPFDRVYIDLSDKPGWFRAVSPLGKVPLLKVDQKGAETVLFESAVILEYLEETQPMPLHPEDPLERARHRSWMEFGSAILNGISRFYNAPTDERLCSEAGALSDMFQRIENELSEPNWFSGKTFSLVDAVYGPIFRYFDTFDQITDFNVFAGKPKTMKWRSALAQRPSVKMAVQPDYPQLLLSFLVNRNSAISRFITTQK